MTDQILKIFSLETLVWCIVLMPLLGASINAFLAVLGAKKEYVLAKPLVSFVGVFFPAMSFVIACFVFLTLAGFEGDSYGLNTSPLFVWHAQLGLLIECALKFDQLSTVMVLVVSGVGSLIHLYSVGYMAHDRAYARYFALLNLFVFFMLILVMADNLLLMFVGWEGVGVCSYLLIGFWFEDRAKAIAGIKAFVVNRIGDAGFLVAMFLIFAVMKAGGIEATESAFNFEVMERYSAYFLPFATVIALLLFAGATGKSAQIPLYVWLPDAMAGPTPVSALIHAATMVTAGVYMIARMNFLFILSPYTMELIAVVGAVTALMAALMGFAETDLKKILAYSTISQLGYMFIAAGVGAFSASGHEIRPPKTVSVAKIIIGKAMSAEDS